MSAEKQSGVQQAWQPALINLQRCRLSPLRFFRDFPAAFEHIRDHLLEESEAEAWCLVIPQLSVEFGELGQKSQRHRTYQKAKQDREVFEKLYDLYRESVSRNLADACRQGWKQVRGEQGHWQAVAFGSSGVLILAANGLVLTAFLPNQSSAERTLLRRGSLAPARLAGKRRMRGGLEVASERELRKRRQIEARWSPEERLFYRVFRPALSFIRRQQYETFSPTGPYQPRDNDYWLLKAKVPTASRFDYQQWRRLRQQLRGRVYDAAVN